MRHDWRAQSLQVLHAAQHDFGDGGDERQGREAYLTPCGGCPRWSEGLVIREAAGDVVVLPSVRPVPDGVVLLRSEEVLGWVPREICHAVPPSHAVQLDVGLAVLLQKDGKVSVSRERGIGLAYRDRGCRTVFLAPPGQIRGSAIRKH